MSLAVVISARQGMTKEFSMNPFSAVQRRLMPLGSLMSFADYRRVKRTAPLTSGSTTINGHSVRFSDAPGVLHSAAEIFRDQVYRFKARTSQPFIIDAGANIGLSVLYFKSLYPEATIIAYEPDPTIFALLQDNVGQLPGVDLHQAAAWIEDTDLTFYSEGSLAGSTEIDTESRQKTTTVRAERLRSNLEGTRVDFLKIDIEGGENELLFDLKDCLGNVDCLFFEYHSMPNKPQRLGDLLDLVSRQGFRYVINGAHGSSLPFVHQINRGFDLQLNVSCFRP